MKILKESFGVTKKGEAVTKYKIINDQNSHISVLNYGGIITEICVPDKFNNIENVVLGFDNFKDYEENSPHFGALTGRNAGRISNAEFEIDHILYKLPKNNSKNNLHGGPGGLDKKVWKVEEFIEENSAYIKLFYLSADGEEGFPGSLEIEAMYKFNNDNELEIIYKAKTDKKTIVNLTNHSYFNLSGNLKRDVLNQVLTVKANKFCAIDKEAIPTGEIIDVKNTAFDFTSPKIIGKDLNADDEQLKNVGGYDHPFILNEHNSPQIIFTDLQSGRILEISTSEPVVVIYSANSLKDDLILSSGVKSKKHLGICFETQYYVDAINQTNFPTFILQPGEVYNTYSKYKFK